MGWIVRLLIAAILVAGFAVRKSDLRQGEEEFRRLSASLDERIEAYEARERPPRKPVFGDPVPGEAWDYYRKAGELLDDLVEPLGDADDECFFALLDLEAGVGPIPAVLRKYRELAEPACQLLFLGARTAESGEGFDVRQGILVGELHEAIGAVNSARKPMKVRAAIQTEDGDLAGAVDTLRVLFRLGEDVGGLPGSIHHLVGITVRSEAVRGLAGLVGSGALPEDQLVRISKLLEGQSEPVNPVFVLEGEQLYIEAMLRTLLLRTERVDWLAEGFDARKRWAEYRKAADAARAEISDGDPYVRFGEAIEGALGADALFARASLFRGLRKATDRTRASQAALRIGIEVLRAKRLGHPYMRPLTTAPIVFRDVDGRFAIFLEADLEEAGENGEEARPFFLLE